MAESLRGSVLSRGRKVDAVYDDALQKECVEAICGAMLAVGAGDVSLSEKSQSNKSNKANTKSSTKASESEHQKNSTNSGQQTVKVDLSNCGIS